MRLPKRDHVTIKGACQILGIHRATIKRWEKKGLVRFKRTTNDVIIIRIVDLWPLYFRFYTKL